MKNISLYNHIHFLAILYPTSLGNLVVEVGTMHCRQILLDPWSCLDVYETYMKQKSGSLNRNLKWRDQNLLPSLDVKNFQVKHLHSLYPLQWRNNEFSGITNVSIFYSTVCSGADQRKHQKVCVTGLCEGNSPVTGEFPTQRASNVENVSIWWLHHEWKLLLKQSQLIPLTLQLFLWEKYKN